MGYLFTLVVLIYIAIDMHEANTKKEETAITSELVFDN